MNDQRFADTLKRKLTGLSTPPPESWWADIEAALPAASASPGKPPRRHILLRRRAWWAMAAACAAVAIVVASIVALQTTDVSTTAHTNSRPAPSSQSLTQQLAQAIEEAKTAGDALSRQQTPLSAGREYSPRTPGETEMPLTAKAAAGDSEAERPQTAAPTAVQEAHETPARPEPRAFANPEARNTEPQGAGDAYYERSVSRPATTAEATAPKRERASGGKPAAQLYIAGCTAGRESSTSAALAPYQMGVMQSDNYIAAESPKQHTSTTNLHEKHLPPFALGADIAIPLAGRWSLQTGVAYAMLASTFTQQLPTRVEHQKAHFVGIPLRIAASVIERRNWNVYLAAGGEWEKCVAVHTDQPAPTAPERPHQWSMQAAAGGEYRLSPAAALYLETGFGYYFDTSTTLRTAYQAHPANFSLKLGVRFSPRSK